jgi:kinesin family protein 2/24
MHRKHIDENVDLVKRQMMILNNVDKPGSDVTEYLESLDHILGTHLDLIKQIKTKMQSFRGYLS